ncbi:MAG: glycosyltransferase family 2 protein [Vulcanimicrobiota bacterium]
MNVALIIPVYEPDERFVELISELQQREFSKILVVDDGSRDTRPFEGLSVSVCLHRHESNQGKGAALKTGMAKARKLWPDSCGIVTMDADWQHLPSDAVRVAQAFETQPGSIVLGIRRFQVGRTPWKSLLGNTAINFLLQRLSGLRLSDTQTGLRALPMSFLPRLLKLPSNGYEFEMECLLALRQEPIRQVEIMTVYHGDNRNSHFKPLCDSVRILVVLFRWWLRKNLMKTASGQDK